ncbi:hypothetical protein [Pararhizobium sp. IMCC21322]|uniref:hypothetical protein n=1 Tax=Pararhizobium sp. IMCC21322 TaxID=3067903 RepID=UPI0027425BAD|nr:hypothetical protein [Pararhizobium sp. IMCC21322]
MAQSDAGLISGKIRELTRLIRETRLADTLSDVSDQEPTAAPAATSLAGKLANKIRSQMRLDALAQSLRTVYTEIPKVAKARQDAFTFALLPGKPPRFWVDLTSFVVMTDGGQTFHFMKDTRDGRITLFESDSLEDTANAVTDYVAERIVQQRSDGHIVDPVESPELQAEPQLEPQPPQPDTEQISEVAQTVVPVKTQIPVAAHQAVVSQHPVSVPAPIVIQPAPARTDWVKLFLAFALGLFVGAVALFLAAWFQTPAAL